MIVPDRLSQVETRGETILSYIHRVLKSDVIQDGLYISQVMKWGIHRHSVFLTWQVIFLGLLGTFQIIKDVGRTFRLSPYAHPY
jgi:hypothetical protein